MTRRTAAPAAGFDANPFPNASSEWAVAAVALECSADRLTVQFPGIPLSRLSNPRGNQFVVAKRTKTIRDTFGLGMQLATRSIARPGTVLERFGDAHPDSNFLLAITVCRAQPGDRDGLAVACKYVIDTAARFIGIDDGDPHLAIRLSLYPRSKERVVVDIHALPRTPVVVAHMDVDVHRHPHPGNTDT